MTGRNRQRRQWTRNLTAAAVTVLFFAALAADTVGGSERGIVRMGGTDAFGTAVRLPLDWHGAAPDGSDPGDTGWETASWGSVRLGAPSVDTFPAEQSLSAWTEDPPDGTGNPVADGTADGFEDQIAVGHPAEDPPDADTDQPEALSPDLLYAASTRRTDGDAEESIFFQGEWVALSRSVEHSHLKQGDFVWSGDRVKYTGDRYDVSFGIDVSSHHNDDRRDGTLDWEAAKADGVEFVFVRVGYRGTTEGVLYEDPCYARNIDGAMAAGLVTGAYIFSQAKTVEEAMEEADFLIERLRDHPINAPVCYDWEVQDRSSRAYHVRRATATDCAEAFCRRIAEAGYTPLIYESKHVGYMRLDKDALPPYLVWYPQYPGKSVSSPCPDYRYQMDLWQFSDQCSVAGIGRRVDGNLWFRLKPEAVGEA